MPFKVLLTSCWLVLATGSLHGTKPTPRDLADPLLPSLRSAPQIKVRTETVSTCPDEPGRSIAWLANIGDDEPEDNALFASLPVPSGEITSQAWACGIARPLCGLLSHPVNKPIPLRC
jgi:hypothetical protein